MIDDEEEICNLTKEILERTGRFEVFASTHALEGIRLAREHAPDLVLLDVRMCEMDGTEVARRLCEEPATKVIPIAFLTAIAIPMVFLASLIADEHLKEKTSRAGGPFFIQKPITPQELIRRIDDILDRLQ